MFIHSTAYYKVIIIVEALEARVDGEVTATRQANMQWVEYTVKERRTAEVCDSTRLKESCYNNTCTCLVMVNYCCLVLHQTSVM